MESQYPVQALGIYEMQTWTWASGLTWSGLGLGIWTNGKSQNTTYVTSVGELAETAV